MKEIVFVTPKSLSNIGGGEKVLCQIANLLSDVYKVTVISLYGEDSYFNYNERVKIITLGQGYSRNKILRRFSLFVSLLKVRHILKTNYDVEIAFSLIGSVLLFLFKAQKGRKNVCWLHTSFYQPLPRLISILRKPALKSYDKVISINSSDTELYAKINATARIPNPVMTHVASSQIQRKYELLSIGRLSKDKGFDRLILICSKVLNKFPSWTLNIYGQDDGEKDNLMSLIHNLGMSGRINIINPVHNIEEIYQQASIFVFASHYECFSLVLVEAMSYGLPIVAYDVPSGMKDLVINDYNGYLIKDDDEKEYYQKLYQLMESEELRDVMGENGIIEAQNYEKDIIKQKWINLIEE